MQETRVPSLGWEDSLEKEMADMMEWKSRTRLSNFTFTLSILGITFGIGMKTDISISFHVAIAEFSKFASILSAALSQHHLLGFEIAQLEFHHLHYSLNK